MGEEGEGVVVAAAAAAEAFLSAVTSAAISLSWTDMVAENLEQGILV